MTGVSVASGLGVNVAGVNPAFVGTRVAVTKSGFAETCESTSTEIQDVSRRAMGRNNTFLRKDEVAVFRFCFVGLSIIFAPDLRGTRIVPNLYHKHDVWRTRYIEFALGE